MDETDLPRGHEFLAAQSVGDQLDLGTLPPVLDELRHALAGAYERHNAGQVVTFEVLAHSPGRSDGADAKRTLRDLASTALFAEGFVEPRYASTGDGRLYARAVRGAQRPPTRRRQLLSVIVAVYNERATFRDVMDRLLEQRLENIDLEIILVESNSTDGTRDDVLSYADRPGVQVVLEDRPRGKGHAVRSGFAAATGDYILIQDADLEYSMDDYLPLLEPLVGFEASFVLGSRKKTFGARFGIRHFETQVLVSRLINVGNFLFLHLFNFVYGQSLSDPFTMYKVLRRDCLYGLLLEANRFDFDWELVAKLLRAGYTPVEIPVAYHSRSFSEGKKVSLVRDPISWVRACLKYRVAPFELPLSDR